MTRPMHPVTRHASGRRSSVARSDRDLSGRRTRTPFANGVEQRFTYAAETGHVDHLELVDARRIGA
ncbi:hypothetical protein [Nonomuraea sp. NPDC049709]|uniref:hypothetical protein n=1 Tax=Nonomuraea sp. NPDC049709 TaxID=3154736 RepID=UPI0034374FFB